MVINTYRYCNALEITFWAAFQKPFFFSKIETEKNNRNLPNGGSDSYLEMYYDE